MLLEILKILKIDLQINANDYDDYLTGLIQHAIQLIERTGIKLTDSMEDVYIVEMYAAHLYRRRRDAEGPAMPEPLRFALHNRLFSQKAQEAE